MLTLEQLSAVHQEHLNTFLDLTRKAFEGVEKMVELNMQAARATMSENIDHVKHVLSTKDMQELLAMQTGMVQPLAEKAAAYSRQMYEIAATTQAEFTKAAEAKFAENSNKLQNFVETAAKNAPVGSESTVAMVKTMVNAANTAYETAYKTTKQAVEVAEANMQAATAVASKAASQAAAQARSRKN